MAHPAGLVHTALCALITSSDEDDNRQSARRGPQDCRRIRGSMCSQQPTSRRVAGLVGSGCNARRRVRTGANTARLQVPGVA